MQRKTSLLIYISIFIIGLSLAGFYQSYLSHFPMFLDFKGLIHIHFSAFCCWFALIVIQPILIRKKQYELHKKLGRLSYFLIPILVITIVFIRLGKLSEEAADSLKSASMNAFITLFGRFTERPYSGLKSTLTCTSTCRLLVKRCPVLISKSRILSAPAPQLLPIILAVITLLFSDFSTSSM